MSTTNDKKEMSFFGHLEELRWRLVRMAAVIVSLAVIIFIYTEPILDLIYISMSQPDFVTYRFFCEMGHFLGLENNLCVEKIDITLQSVKLTGQFGTNIYFSMVGGVVVAFPFIFWQIWSFIKPGLKQNEKNATKGIVIYASILFLLGIAFGYFVIAPLTIQFFGNYTMSTAIKNIPTISDYIGIITATTFWTGLLFELPIIIYILSKLGMVGPEFLRKYRKHAAVGVLILAAIITPPDFFSQIVVAIPILVLYEISIMVSKRVVNNKVKP